MPALSTTKSHRLLSAAASVNATSVSVGPTRVMRIMGYNARASAVFLKLYNKASAAAETDTPVATIYLPTVTSFNIDVNHFFPLGLSYRATTAGADNDTGALTAADLVGVNILYQ